MSHASAPGKIILFGEHAVVYGQPALAVPVTQVNATVEVSESTDGCIWIAAPDIGLHAALDELPATHPLAAAILSTLEALGIPLVAGRMQEIVGERERGALIRISSTIPVASGLGSGAAVSVALARALSAYLGRPLDNEEVSRIAYEIEKLHHGTPSGIDNTVITFGRPVYFIKGTPAETFGVGAPFTLVIGDTGIPAPTKESVEDVRKLWRADQPRWERVFEAVGAISRQARVAIESGRVNALGPLLDTNHALLQELTVSSPELDRLVSSARAAGATGAKLSGGGRGGNMIALADANVVQKVADALLAAGAQRTIITTIS